MIRAAQSPKVKRLDEVVRLRRPPHEGRQRSRWWERG